MKTINLYIPTSWNELQPRHLKKLSSYFFNNIAGKKLDLLVFFTLINIKWYQFLKATKILKVLKQVPLSELKKHYNFIYTKTNLTTFIPNLKINSQVYFSPAARMHDISIDEFATAEDLFIKFKQTNNIEYLRYLTAVLYFKIDDKGNKIPFNKSQLETKVKNFKKIKQDTLLAIGLSYQGSSMAIQSKYTVVFPKKNKINTKSKPKTKKANYQTSGLGNLITALTDGKLYHLNTIKTTNVHDFLSDYQNKLIKQKNNGN